MSNNSNVPIWEENALNLSESFNLISGSTATIGDLSGFTKFEWDELYSFQAYFPKDEIYKTVGYKWADISETVNEGMNQIVFLNDGEVVCYLYGYPDRYNLYFEFGYHRDGYFLLNSNENLAFEMTVIDDIRYFKYINE